MAKTGELSSVQKRMVGALLLNRKIGDACQEVGIGRSTLARWMTDPLFNQALLAAEQEALKDTTRTMLAGKEDALSTLHKLMTESEHDNVRRQAAVDWLGFMHRSYELQNLEARLIALELAQQGVLHG